MQSTRDHFLISPLSLTYQQGLIKTGLWNIHGPVPLTRLRLLQITYCDFSGQTHVDGQLIVMDAVAQAIAELFHALLCIPFPIAKLRLTSEYHGDDALSMRDNNSSVFNNRPITGGTLPSLHAYGLAIDLNPLQNPYVNLDQPEASPYLDRQNQRPGMCEPIVNLFKQHGFFIWGGHWKNPIDYQHFQTSRFVAQLLATMTPAFAEAFFDWTRQTPDMIALFQPEHYASMAALYHQAPGQFVDFLQKE